MTTYEITSNNLISALRFQRIQILHTYNSAESTRYCAKLVIEDKLFPFKCEINDKKVIFQLSFPVCFDSETEQYVQKYIDMVNVIYGTRGTLKIDGIGGVVLLKELSFSNFYLSKYTLNYTIYGIKSQIAEYAETIQNIGKGVHIPDDNSIASSLLYEMPFVTLLRDNSRSPNSISENTPNSFSIDEMIRRIDAQIEKINEREKQEKADNSSEMVSIHNDTEDWNETDD